MSFSRILLAFALLSAIPQAYAFCGFYVAKADAKLFNKASQVVIARDGDRTVLTMSNDYQGEAKDFAMVVPVPVVLEREQIHVTERKFIEHLDAYTSPRLVEYFDPDPCIELRALRSAALPAAKMESQSRERANSLGVTIEASYTVGEYDILILSAKQSNGLITWLEENGYRIPKGANEVLGSYLKQNLKFFVAKVNLEEQNKLGFSYLRPLQMAFESPKFMLPIRLGTVNAQGPQELFIYTLTRNGRVESTNYRTVRLPSDLDVPGFLKQEFGKFYVAMFDKATEDENRRAVFLEYAWDMGWCDPCAADPLSRDELRELGVFWENSPFPDQRLAPQSILPMPTSNAFVTRLHVRYDAAHFPEDLAFQETGDRSNFQGRYIIRNAWQGPANCPAAERYFKEVLPLRKRTELDNLARLTGWDKNDFKDKVAPPATPPDASRPDRGAVPPGSTNPPSTAPTDTPRSNSRGWWKGMWKDNQ